jgi:hypothetical protein
VFGYPDINGFFDMLYGTGGVDLQALTFSFYGGASGIVFGYNPPYTLTDFLGMYPKFFGTPTVFTSVTITAASTTISGFTDTTGLVVGQLLVNLNSFVSDTIITAVDPIAKTISVNVAPTSSDTTFLAYEAPFVPLVVMVTYVLLASSSVMMARYNESWFVAMSLFVAHYLTLYMRTESGPNSTASEIASSGLTKGILIHRGAGDVSATSQLIQGYEQWGAWAETQYGELFITIARATNCGPVWVP